MDSIFYFAVLALILIGFFKTRNSVIRNVAIGIFLVCLAVAFIPFSWFPKIDLLKKLEAGQTISIGLKPSEPEWNVNLTSESKSLETTDQIQQVISSLKKVRRINPRHPETIWETSLIMIDIYGDSILLEIHQTSNNGTLIYSGNNVFRNDSLGAYLERLTHYMGPKKSE